MIIAKNIHKVYRNGNKELAVLKGIDLAIEKGKFAAITGPSGAGKSTLLHILGGLDTPTQGKVIFKEKDLYSLSGNELSHARNTGIGFVFQFYHLLADFTVLENVLMPARIKGVSVSEYRAKRERAVELLEQVGLGMRLKHFPSELSGGEKQRAALVRGLINKPDLLLCDEPTGNLDSKAGQEVIALIKKINQDNQMTVILVTHNLELTKTADYIYHLKDGILS